MHFTGRLIIIVFSQCSDKARGSLKIQQHFQETTKNLLKICVESRNNEFICKVLDVLKEKKFLQVNDDENNEQEEAGESWPWLSLAVLYATINDDFETLEAIADWTIKKDLLEENPCNDAMELACLKDHNHCIKHLYDLNYRIYLHEEDESKIQNLMSMPNLSNGLNFHRKRKPNPIKDDASMGNESAMFLDSETGKTPTKKKEKRRKKRINHEYDKVERYLSLKAYSNPHYLISEFHESLKDTVNNNADFECCQDPLRKSLAIGSYAKSLSKYSSLYSREFQDISKVSKI